LMLDRADFDKEASLLAAANAIFAGHSLSPITSDQVNWLAAYAYDVTGYPGATLSLMPGNITGFGDNNTAFY